MSQKYDKEFKIQTVKMIQEQGKPELSPYNCVKMLYSQK